MRKGLFLSGLLVLGIGFYIVLHAIGILPLKGSGQVNWILGLTGLSFVVGGGLVCLGELLRHDHAPELRDVELARSFRNLLITVLVAIFIVLGNWVAFGPGERPILSIFGLTLIDRQGEWLGRFGFGISAVLLDSLVAWIAIARWRSQRRLLVNRS